MSPTGGNSDREAPGVCCLLLSCKSRSSWAELRRIWGGTRGGEDELLLFDDILRRSTNCQTIDRQQYRGSEFGQFHCRVKSDKDSRTAKPLPVSEVN